MVSDNSSGRNEREGFTALPLKIGMSGTEERSRRQRIGERFRKRIQAAYKVKRRLLPC
jgi:hypothetical protein